jgi:hypothetical protein
MGFQVLIPVTTKNYCSLGCDIVSLIGKLYLRNLMPFRKGASLHYTVYIVEGNRPNFQYTAHVYVCVCVCVCVCIYIYIYIYKLYTQKSFNMVITVLILDVQTHHTQ